MLKAIQDEKGWGKAGGKKQLKTYAVRRPVQRLGSTVFGMLVLVQFAFAVN